MSRLEELIEGLCLNGVEYRKLGDCAQILIGEFVRKDKQSDNGIYPVYNGGVSNTGYYDECNRPANRIIVSARGANAGFVNRVFKPFWSGNSCYTIELFVEDVDWDFLYYYLKSKEKKLIDNQQKGGIPAVSKKQLIEFKIPVPPMEIQREIVRILDNFTGHTKELTEALTAELTARKQQYEYYRNDLLISNKNIKYSTLKEICEYSNDRIDASEVDEKTYVGVDNILQNKEGKTISTHVPVEGRLIKFSVGDILIGNIRPYLKKIWLADECGGTNGDVLVIHIKDQLQVIPKYLYYILSSDAFFRYDEQNSKGAKMPRGDKKAIMNYLLPIPSIAEQYRVVNILNYFEIYCNDLTVGLLAEIEARQKQYEYYRDKLLTFKEKTA